MKNLLVALALVLSVAVGASAQTYPNSTTLSANITSTQTVFSVASGTNVQAGGGLLIDAEFMPIIACQNTACTSVQVTRQGRPITHSLGAVVTVVRAAARATTMLPHAGAFRVGQCSTSTSSSAAVALTGYQFLPFIDIDTGDMYMCRRNGAGAAGAGTWVWNVTNVQNVNGTAGSVWTAWP